MIDELIEQKGKKLIDIRYIGSNTSPKSILLVFEDNKIEIKYYYYSEGSSGLEIEEWEDDE